MPNYDCSEREFDLPENNKATGIRALRIVITEGDWEKLDEPEWVIWSLDEDQDEMAS